MYILILPAYLRIHGKLHQQTAFISPPAEAGVFCVNMINYRPMNCKNQGNLFTTLFTTARRVITIIIRTAIRSREGCLRVLLVSKCKNELESD